VSIEDHPDESELMTAGSPAQASPVAALRGSAGQPGPGRGCPEGCEDCAECRNARTRHDEFVYAIGKFDVRFPTLGIEREFQQCEARLTDETFATATRGTRTRVVLESNTHLARNVCYVFAVGGLPAYVVVPTSVQQAPELLSAIENMDDPNYWCVLIGRRGPIASPATCAGIVAPIVTCDQLYSFSMDEWTDSLHARVATALKTRKVTRDGFSVSARELFTQITRSTENIGATQAHRALNYFIMQHPGVFLAVSERAGAQRLQKIETRLILGLGLREQVAVITSFVDITTGVTERLFTRIDVTEEWPFVADGPDGTAPPLGLEPFVDNAILGTVF
jgi:hypothetical protein